MKKKSFQISCVGKVKNMKKKKIEKYERKREKEKERERVPESKRGRKKRE